MSKKIFLLLFLVMVTLAYAISEEFVSVVDNQGKEVGRKLSFITKDKLEYLSIDDLIKIFPATSPRSFKISHFTFLFAENNNYFAINQNIYNLSYPTIQYEDRNYLPLKSFMDITNRVTNNNLFAYNSAKIVINISSPSIIKEDSEKVTTVKESKNKFNISSITISEKKNGTAIILHTDKKYSNKDISSSLNRNNNFYLTIYKATLDPEILDTLQTKGVLAKVGMIQQKNSLQLNVDLKWEVLSRTVLIKDKQIIINLQTEKRSEIVNEQILDKLKEQKESWLLNKIIIDPGHGGKDPGAIDPSGTYEKDITLKIAIYLKELLDNEGSFKTLMTRDKDKFIELKERTKFANHHGGKLFVSIHCNANKSNKVSGYESFFLKPARTENALEVAAFENSVIKYEQDRSDYKELTDKEYIILSMMQANFAKESEMWAGTVQDKMAEVSEFKNRGVDQAGFYVLVGASMPAILFEAGFISNKEEEKKLKSTSYQKEIAKALYNSIINLKKRVEYNE